MNMDQGAGNRKPRESGKCSMGENLRGWAELVCRVLQNSGPLTLAGLARRMTNLSAGEIAMAVGWLAREGKVEFFEIEERWAVRMRRINE